MKSLYINCNANYGDVGSPIDKLLHGLPSLRVLHINAPDCNYEGYDIRGLTWAYNFPQLTHLAISIFYRSAQDMGSFLANHPNIRTLMFNAEGEEPIPNAASLLPNLEALSMNNWGQTAMAELLSANPPRKITYFKTERSPYAQCRLIPQYAPSLQCLELNLSLEAIRNETDQYRTMITFLPLVPDLSELAIQFSSGWTTYYHEEFGVRDSLPMDEETLSKILKALPKSSNLQVLRMKDNDVGKGSPLSVQSSTFASLRDNIPSNLKVLQWEIDNSRVRYEFEPGQSVRIVDPPEQHWPDTLLWTDESILKHLGETFS